MGARDQNQSDYKYMSSQETGEFRVKESEFPQVAEWHLEPKV